MGVTYVTKLTPDTRLPLNVKDRRQKRASPVFGATNPQQKRPHSDLRGLTW